MPAGSEIAIPITPRPASETRQEWVYRQLREAIMTGAFVPGRSVTLRGVAAALGVSPMPVREALHRLVAERALESHDNRRVSVPRMSRAKLAELCSARIALETQAALRALPAIHDPDLVRLRQLDTAIDSAIAAHNITAYLRTHRAFHLTLYGIAPSPVLMPLIDSLWLQFSPFMGRVMNHVESYSRNDRHLQLLDALARRDIAATRFALEADIREGLGALSEQDWGVT